MKNNLKETKGIYSRLIISIIILFLLLPFSDTNVIINVIPLFVLIGIQFAVEVQYFSTNIIKRILDVYIFAEFFLPLMMH